MVFFAFQSKFGYFIVVILLLRDYLTYNYCARISINFFKSLISLKLSHCLFYVVHNSRIVSFLVSKFLLFLATYSSVTKSDVSLTFVGIIYQISSQNKARDIEKFLIKKKNENDEAEITYLDLCLRFNIDKSINF